MAQQGQEGQQAQRSGGEHPARHLEVGFGQLQPGFPFQFGSHRCLQVAGIGQDVSHGFDDAVEGVLVLPANVEQEVGDVRSVFREPHAAASALLGNGQTHAFGRQHEKLPTIDVLDFLGVILH